MRIESLVEIDSKIPINRSAKRVLDDSLGLDARVAIALQERAEQTGEREIYVTLDDIAGKLGLKKLQVYQSLYRKARKGEIELLKENWGKNNRRERIVGVKLNKNFNVSAAIKNGLEKAKRNPHLERKTEPKVISTIVNLNRYMEKKVAIEKARQILIDAGLNPEEGLNLEPDPIAEEGITILYELMETKQRLTDAQVDLEAMRKLAPFTKEEEVAELS